MEFILKSSLLIGIFYSFYKLFLQKETFFKSIRVYFIIGLIITLIFPLIIIPIYVESVNETINFIPEISGNNSITTNNFIVKNNITHSGQETIIKNGTPFNWFFLFKTIYILGVAFFSLKFLIEIISLYRLVHKSNQLKKGKITFAETLKNISPFSIFNYIVYNKNLFDKTELLQIIEHEKVHVNHNHSYDMLLVHLLVIVQWFNPFAWLYKKDVEQNLEFLADKFAKENHETLKEYQYLLLKASVKNYPFALSTNFYNSLIKKRIIMLQKSPSKKLNQLKYLLILPLIAIFLLAFNTKEYVKPTIEKIHQNLPHIKNNGENIQFVNPIHPENVIKISSNYGERTNPFTNKKKFHKGIDIIAHEGVDVYATANGIVTKASYHNLKGNHIQITHKDNYKTNYHHLGEIQIALDERVKAGDIISTVGNTGKSTGPHLHYEVVKEGVNINPINFIQLKSKLVKTTSIQTNLKEKAIKLIIKKNSTTKELDEIKKILEKKGVTISFTKIKRNAQNEIIFIKIVASIKNSDVSYESSDTDGINDIRIKFENNSINIGDNIRRNKHTNHRSSGSSSSHSNIHIINDDDNHDNHKDTHFSHHEETHIDDNGEKTTVIYLSGNGNDKNISFTTNNNGNTNRIYTLNGKTITTDELKNLNHNSIKSIEITKNKNIHINTKNSSNKETSRTKSHSFHSDNGVVYENSSAINYKGKTYYYYIKNNKTTFYNKFEEEVNQKTSKKLLKFLKKQLQ